MNKLTNAKQVNQKHTPKEVNLSYISLLEKGCLLKDIARINGVSIPYVSKVIKRLKACGAVSRIGYGVWNVDRSLYYSHLKQVNQITGCRSRDTPPVRGHGFRFFVRLPEADYGKFMGKADFVFKEVPGGFSFELFGHRVKLFLSGSLDVYFKSGWSVYADSSHVSFRAALVELERILVRFECLFDIGLSRPFKFGVTRQHYALIKNELAKDCDDRKEKLKVLAEDGRTWLLVDNSFALHELEAQHQVTARDDSEKVKAFFNGVREVEGFTPQFVLGMFKGLIEDRAFHAENMRRHVEAIETLGVKVAAFSDVVEKFVKDHQKP
jgi:hypothetical protein